MEALTHREQATRPGPMLAMGRAMVRVGLTSQDDDLPRRGWDLINRANALARLHCCENDRPSHFSTPNRGF
jgi:hypothetical protein